MLESGYSNETKPPCSQIIDWLYLYRQFSKNSLWPRITNCCQNNMRTDHEELCGSSYGSFCMNGGICYMIPTVSSPFCRCIENYTGARCEETLLPSIKNHTRGELFAAFLASVVVLSILIAGAIFLLCRKGHIPRASSIERGDNLIEASGSNGSKKITE